MDVLHDACPFAAANFTDFIARERIGELMLRPASRLCSDFPISDRWRISLPAVVDQSSNVNPTRKTTWKWRTVPSSMWPLT